jgi:hypothetical protein
MILSWVSDYSDIYASCHNMINEFFPHLMCVLVFAPKLYNLQTY